MSGIIYTSFCTSVRERKFTEESIESIIALIRSEKYKGIGDAAKSETDESKVKALKLSLPAFYPSIILGPDGTLNENSRPTGIVQFDIDTEHNQHVDLTVLKKEVSDLPECVYAFHSIRGGLKFGILTDFPASADIRTGDTKTRFKLAFHHCLSHVLLGCSNVFTVDYCAQQIDQACFLSHDPSAFFHANAAVLSVDDRCIITPKTYSAPEYSAIADVKIALANIPRNLRYAERESVNLCVLYMLGEAGIPLLMAHWKVENPLKLNGDLRSYLRKATYGNIGQLWNLAKKHGYKAPQTHKRPLIRPQKSTDVLEPLATAEEATHQLRSIIHDFVADKVSRFINVTTGAGKTRTVLEMLVKELTWHTNILVLVPSHDLAEEIVRDFKDIKNAYIGSKTLLGEKFNRNYIIALKGKDKLCENQPLLRRYSNNKIAIPWEQCAHDCPMFGECAYTVQFDDRFSNIRVMTHQEWKNEQSAWNKGWKPDYIVIDENVITMGEKIEREKVSVRFPSIELIVKATSNGKPFSEAVWECREAVIADSRSNYSTSTNFVDTESYITACVAAKAKNRFSRILDHLKMYCNTGDKSYLQGMWVEDYAIYWLEIKLAHDRYAKVPTLFLDATANKDVIEALMPGIPFYQIAVKTKEDINLYQMANETFSKEFLKDEKKLQRVIEGLKKIVAKYSNVGIITYKNLGNDKQFYKTLADTIGASKYMYFGNLRGINELKDVDCLLIVGRHFIDVGTIRGYVRAIFNETADTKPSYADRLARMRDGSTYTVNCFVGSDGYTQAIYEHFSLAETRQAIGRGRTVFGCAKDIFVFAQDSLTTDTEVTDFFLYEDYFALSEVVPKPPSTLISCEIIERAIEQGYVYNMPKELAELFKPANKSDESLINWVKRNSSKIEVELIDAGFVKLTLTVKYKNSNKRAREYFIFDSTEKLKQALLSKGEKLME